MTAASVDLHQYRVQIQWWDVCAACGRGYRHCRRDGEFPGRSGRFLTSPGPFVRSGIVNLKNL